MYPIGVFGGKSRGYEVTNSGAFAKEETDHLFKSPSSSNRKTWSYSLWIKRSSIGDYHTLLSAGLSVDDRTGLRFFLDNLNFFHVVASVNYSLSASEVYKDVSEYYHIVLAVDTTQSVSTDRVLIEVNGDPIALTGTYPLLNADCYINSTEQHKIGANIGALEENIQGFDGYMSEIHFIDGQRLLSSNFAETNTITGKWEAKPYEGTYGSNGFYLKFQNAGVPGADSSGEGNGFTNSGVIQSFDTPYNNLCTLNTIDPLTTATITNNSLTATGGNAKITIRPTTGKWYYEKDGIGVEHDCGISGTLDPTLTSGTFTFAESEWAGSPTAGFQEISTRNLAEPDIINSDNYFKSLVYDDGAGSKIVGFQPDLVWLKSRGSAFSNKLVDSIRGVTKFISSDSSIAQGIEATGLTSFNVDGFTVGADTDYSDTTGLGMVAMCWKKATISGFDIVQYTGNGTSQNIGHSLGVAPSLIIFKSLSSRNWAVTSQPILGSNFYLTLNATFPKTDNGSLVNNVTTTQIELGSFVGNNANAESFIAYMFAEIEGFSKISSYLGNNDVDGPFIDLGFKPAFVLIKSVVGSFSWYMFDNERNPYNPEKSLLQANVASAEYSSLVAGEYIDFVSTGFKIRSVSGAFNVSGAEYMYMAFAEDPFKYTRAR